MAQILNKHIRVNVRQRAFKYWFAQTSGFVLMATVAILYLTTEKNHPVGQRTIFVQIFKIFGCHQNHGY